MHTQTRRPLAPPSKGSFSGGANSCRLVCPTLAYIAESVKSCSVLRVLAVLQVQAVWGLDCRSRNQLAAIVTVGLGDVKR